MSDYYQVLGVQKTASDDEIKKAYRKLAMRHHPDKGGSTEEFQKIQEAYDTLSDPQKRLAYDNPRPQGGFQFTGAGGIPPEFAEIFGTGWNPFEGFFNQHMQRSARNKNLNMQVKLSLNEAYQGKQLLATVKLPSGKEQVIDVKIPQGIQDGTTLRVSGIGDDTYPNVPRGDIHITVSIIPHPTFTRKGDDLISNVTITCIDAMLGRDVIIKTIDDKELQVKIPSGTQPGQILAIQGFGMPNMNDPRFKGRLLINVNVTVPSQLTEVQISELKKLFT